MASFTTPRPPFCEGALTGAPEIMNTISSLAMICVSAHGFIRSNYLSPCGRVAISSLFICGFGSMGYHYTLWHGFALLDEVPMVIGLMAGLTEIVDAVFGFRSRLGFLNVLLVTFTGILAIVFAAIKETEQYFEVVFGLMAIAMVPYALLLKKKRGARALSPEAEAVFWRGVVASVLAGTVWIPTEIACKNKIGLGILPLIPTHAFWHCAISYGMFVMVQSGAYNTANLDKRSPELDHELFLPIVRIPVKAAREGGSSTVARH